jgi:hypothetical protein
LGSITTISTSPSSSGSSSGRRYRKHSSSNNSSHHSRSPLDIPLPSSVASASTIFLNGVDVDSHVLPFDARSGSRASHKSHHTHRSRSSTRSKRSSKFDEPVLPSDSVSQVSTNVSSRRSGKTSSVRR